MSELKISIFLPDQTIKSVWAGYDENIGDFVRLVFRDNFIAEDPGDFVFLKNNRKELDRKLNFRESGLAQSDELHICRKAAAGPGRAYGPEVISFVKEARNFHQLGIFVLDGSGSMENEGEEGIVVGEQVNRAVRAFFKKFKGSSKANNFSMAVLTFDDMVKVHTPVTELGKINELADYNPVPGHRGETYIHVALKAAEDMAAEFLGRREAKDMPHSVVVIVMSDGMCMAAEETIAAAEQLKKNKKITICTSLFTMHSKKNAPETAAASGLLTTIATSPQHFRTTYREDDLRNFFIASLSQKR